MEKADIGLIGLAVMGQNLALNLNDNGYKVKVFNRSEEKTRLFMNEKAPNTSIQAAFSLKELIEGLERPRKLILMIKAGTAVDAMIENCLPYLEAGDIIIDGGNSQFHDSERRQIELESRGLLFLGMGISGGEEGARFGPSLMPGGSPKAWPIMEKTLKSIAAKSELGETCCRWISKGGAGHYVKMVHNGIEYGDMQLICEAYRLMREGLDMSVAEIAKVFERWNGGILKSYLIEITAKILNHYEGKEALVDKIVDSAGQKGSGKWTAIEALEEGYPLSLIGQAVFERYLSSLKEERKEASLVFSGMEQKIQSDSFLEDLEQALYASKIISYAQGFSLISKASAGREWDISLQDLASIWQGGCIIRSQFLEEIAKAFEKNPSLKNITLDPYFSTQLKNMHQPWRRVVSQASLSGRTSPCLSQALAYFDNYRSEVLPANLLQAQRDFFGAHGFERTDAPAGQFFHHEWNLQTANNS